MTKKSRGILTTGLFLPIVVGIIVEVVTDISVLAALWSGVQAAGVFLAQPVTLPLWGTILLPLSGLFVVGAGALILAKRSGVSPGFMAYTSDQLLGLKWRWSYHGGRPSDPIPFCPRCDYQPVLQEVYGHPQSGTEVHCDNCGFSKEFDFPPFEVQDRAARHIQRKLRTGDYKSAFPPQAA